MDYPTRRLLMIPGPTNVPDRIASAMARPMMNHREPAFSNLLKELTEKARYLFQTQQATLTLSASGTGGIEAAVWNVIRPGDKAIVSVFGEFGQRLAEAVEMAGGSAIRVASEFGTTPSTEAFREEIEKQDNVKAVFLVHNETSTGCAIQDLEEISRHANDRGAMVVVDAISSLGGYAIPVDKWGIDICVTGSQKCLAAPPGLTLLSLSKRFVDYVKKSPPRVRYFDLARQLEFLEHWETPFTPAIPLYYALAEALDMLKEEGLENRVARHARLAKMLYRLFGAMGLELFAKEEVRSNTVLAVRYPEGIDDKRFRKTLSDEHSVVIAGGFGNLKGKLFRVGSMGEVSDSHVHRTATGIALTLAKLGFKPDLESLFSDEVSI